MSRAAQIRGMLLEEAVLHLLRRSGYNTVLGVGADPTLHTFGAGLGVRGRGSEHQIDAIADFTVHQPFCNSQRLLVEAKCYRADVAIGIDVVRNAVGVLKDVSEYWVPSKGVTTGRPRYHYQYAVFSASRFSREAQRYAYAQDVYLFPLDRSRYFRPILDAIWQVVPELLFIDEALKPNAPQVSEVRALIRRYLRQGIHEATPNPLESVEHPLSPFVRACRELSFALVAVLGNSFPVFLSPSLKAREVPLQDRIFVRPTWDETGWYLEDQSGEVLFSFDLPEQLFDLYSDDHELTPNRALDLKEDMMATFHAIETRDGRARIINFDLDFDWLQRIRRNPH